MRDFNPSLGAVLKSGESIVTALLNKKQAIDDATGFSEFIQAQSSVLDGMRKFSSQALTDPEIDTLPKRADENASDLYNQASKGLKNKAYSQKFNEWFAGARQDHLNSTEKTYDTRRVQKAESTFQNGVDAAVKNGDRKTLQQLYDDPTSQFIIQREQGTKKDQLGSAMGRIDLQDLTAGAMKQLDAGGIEAAQAFIMDTENLPNVNADLRQKLFTHVKALDTEKQAIQKKGFEDTNNKVEEGLVKKFGDGTLTTKDVQGAGFVGPESATKRLQFDKLVKEEHRATLADRKASETDNPTAEDLSIDAANAMIEPSITLKKSDAAYARHEITKTQWSKVRSIASPRVKAMAEPFLERFKTDVSMKPEVKKAMDAAKADFMGAVGNNMEMSRDEMDKLADSKVEDAIKGVVRDAAVATFAQNPYTQNVRGAVSDAAAGKPLDIRPLAKPAEQELSDLRKKVGEVSQSIDSSGKSFYRDTKGISYWKDPKTGIWWSKADVGKWQTLK
jgi:hypothetical protein